LVIYVREQARDIYVRGNKSGATIFKVGVTNTGKRVQKVHVND